jgi:hypothetical protein
MRSRSSHLRSSSACGSNSTRCSADLEVDSRQATTGAADREHRCRKQEARRGKTRRQRLLFAAMALGPGLVLAEVVGSAFCPLTLSRRLRLFAPPALPAGDVPALALRQAPTAQRRRVAEANHRERRDVLRTWKRIGRRAIRGSGAKHALVDRWRPVARRCSLSASADHSGWGGRLAEADHREQRDVLRTRKRIGRREIRGPGAKTPLLDRRRHVAERCVSRVVELGPRK